ncbi:MAG: alpha/beta hydrolase [bacterium]|nr:alpha/beta hydrolase [bacterium]
MTGPVRLGSRLALTAILAALFTGCQTFRDLDVNGQYFDSADVQIHYFERGTGTPVILAHGLGANASLNWAVTGVVDELAKNHRVVAYDCRGLGKSGKPESPDAYGLEMAEDIARLMDHLGIEKAHIVGYSLGGFTAVKMLELHPDRMLSLAACGSGWTSAREEEQVFMATVADSLEAGDGLGPLTDRLASDGKANALEHLMVNTAVRSLNDEKAMARIVRRMDEFLVDERVLRDCTVPAVAIVGGKDSLKPFADQLAEAMPGTEVIVINRATHVTCPARRKFVNTLREFINAVDAAE